MQSKDIFHAEPIYSGRPEDELAPTLQELHDSRLRWGAMGFSAIMACAAKKEIGIRRFIELADNTQRTLVATVAKDYYAGELGLTEDSLENFLTVTNLGITGAGFDYEVLAEDTETRCVLEANRCPLVDYANMVGYENGDPAMDDLSLWCDTYDNFESEAVTPSQGLIHSHCIGKGDKYCRIICETIDPEEAREDDEHIYDYTARMRKAQQTKRPGGPWVMDNKSPDVIVDMIRDFVGSSVQVQSQIAPTLYDRKRHGSELQGRIGAASVLMAGKLMGWDEFIQVIPDKHGLALRKAAQEKREAIGITESSASDAATLHLALTKGQEFESLKIDSENTNRVEGSCSKCPIVQWGEESGLGDETNHLMAWCTAARTQEAQVIASDLTHTYTHCIGRGDDACRWVIEKNI